MGIKERRDSEKAELKKKIMDAAIDIIHQDGYASLSIRKIAAKIEYSPTTIYLYYKDKAQILTDMANNLYHSIEIDAIQIMNQDTDISLDKKIHAIFCCFIKNFTEEPEIAKIIMHHRMNEIFLNKEMNPFPSNKGIRMLDELFAQGIEEKIIKPNIKNSSWMIISALIGFVLSVIENNIHLLDNFNQITTDFADILIGGMKQ